LDEKAHGWRDAEVAADAAAQRFGAAVVRPASLLGGSARPNGRSLPAPPDSVP
jgi:DNA polymerase-4